VDVETGGDSLRLERGLIRCEVPFLRFVRFERSPLQDTFERCCRRTLEAWPGVLRAQCSLRSALVVAGLPSHQDSSVLGHFQRVQHSHIVSG
jgi:hypothetical protein